MKKTANFTFLRHEQPNDLSWSAIKAFGTQWNERNAIKFSESMGFLWAIEFPDQRDLAYQQFLDELAARRSQYQITYHVTSEAIRDANDYFAADYVEILGTSLEGFPERPFVLNEHEALGPPSPCPECGWRDIFSASQRQPFAIDEALLDQVQPERGETPNGGWDCINLPNGHKLVSRRFVDVLKDAGARGYELSPVLAGVKGHASDRIFQILAQRAILRWQVLGPNKPIVKFCSTCGAALDFPPGTDTTTLPPDVTYCVSEPELNGDDIFSHHPGRGATLYFAQRVYRLLLDARLNGIVPSTTIQSCKNGR
jgi:hypothetical protein